MAFPAWHKLFTRHMSSYFFDPFHLLVLAESSSQVGHGDTIGLRGGDDVEEIHRRRLRKAPTPEDIKMNNFDSNTQSYTFDKVHLQGSDQSWRMRLEELAIMEAKNLRNFVLCGSKFYVRDAFINPKVTYFLFNGFVKSISSIKLAPTGSSKHLSALRDYLESFDCSEDMSLYIQDAKSFIFPESFRKTCSPPLRNLKHNVTAKMPPATEAEDSELRDSLLWIAPSAYIPQIEHWT